MRTRTSIWLPKDYGYAGKTGFGGQIRRPPATSCPRLVSGALGEGLGYGRRNQVCDAAAEGRHLLHPGRRQEAVLGRRDHIHRLDLGRELAVQLVHLELVLEVRDRSQALDD